MAKSKKTENQQWVHDRIKAVSAKYDAYDALIEMGVELGERDMSLQVQCPLPGHGPDNKPSARYYAPDGTGPSHFFCYKCKVNQRGPGLLAIKLGVDFMQAVKELERRFSIKVPRPVPPSIGIPVDKSGLYESDAWSDVPRVMMMLESKMQRKRDRVAMLDYIKWCRLLDAIQWDIDKGGGLTTPAMVSALTRLKEVIDQAGHDIYED